MAAVVIGFALMTALCTGYQVGRHAGSRPSTRRASWHQRTSRWALGRTAASLILLVAIRRVQRSGYLRRALPVAIRKWESVPALRVRRR